MIRKQKSGKVKFLKADIVAYFRWPKIPMVAVPFGFRIMIRKQKSGKVNFFNADIVACLRWPKIPMVAAPFGKGGAYFLSKVKHWESELYRC